MLKNIKYKFYYINLDRSIGRKKYMENFLKNNRHQRIQGLDGKNKNYALRFFVNPTKRRIKNTLPELCCVYSHIKAMKVFLDDKENTDDYAFICEDDLDIHPETKDINFDKHISKLPEDWEIYQLCSGAFSFLKSKSKEKNRNKYLVKFIKHTPSLFGTVIYIIKRKAAERMVNKYLKYYKGNNILVLPSTKEASNITADNFIYSVNKSYSRIPCIFRQHIKNISTIHKNNSRTHIKNYKINKILWNLHEKL